MATTRLRRAFRYPDDSGDDTHDREELDEEEQELVISQLQTQNNKRNSEYSIIFAAIPLFSATVFVPSIFSGSLSLYERFLSLVSLLSLVATAYTMKYSPLLPRPESKDKSSMLKPDSLHFISVNAAVCGSLALAYVFASQTGPAHNSQSFTYLVPGAMLAAIMVARHVMVTVDLKHLEDLRYEYKGA